MRTLILTVLILGLAMAAEPTHPQLPFKLSELKLVDAIDFADANPGHEFEPYPANAPVYKDILGRKALELPNKAGSGIIYFTARIGKGKGLQAGKAYVLVVDYPQDQPRNIIVRNYGGEITRAFHTGPTLGDGLEIPYVYSQPESINYPLSQQWEQWVSVFHLHDRFSDHKRPRGKANRPFTPKDGFHIAIAHFAHKDAPLSKGPAIGRIALYEAPDHKDIALDVVMPPEDLPQRFIYYREEMADGVLGRRNGSQPGVDSHKAWYEYHARVMKYLGINTFAKDLLEFGANQGWDSSKYGGNKWVYQSDTPHLWSDIVDLAVEYDLNVFPYYEYCGSKGQDSYGLKKICKTLNQAGKGPKGRDDYTHISWSEKANADVTDPAAWEDFRKMLDCTVTPFSDKVKFVGVWMRPRNSGMPISFSDRCLQLFAEETGHAPVTRSTLKSDQKAYADYWQWWYGKRQQFLAKIRDYIRDEGGVKDGMVLYTADPSEPGAGIGKKGVVTDAPSLWKTESFSFDDVIKEQLPLKAQLKMRGTWGGWEWQHSVPPPDPQHYKDTDGIIMSYGFNRLYTVSDSDMLEAFRGQKDLAILRHYCLNENALQTAQDKNPLGYFVTDYDVAGPYHMLAEARALAYGDPNHIGYLTSCTYTSGFAEYQRAFNQAFLSLPAVPSQILKDASSNKDVIVRSYPTEGHGTWYAVINTGLTDANDVEIKVDDAKNLKDAINGKAVKAQRNSVTVSLYPGQVLSWRSTK